jgi:lipid-A-disaccharide synthase
MERQGFSAWWPHHKLSVHGFNWDTLRRYPEIVGIRKQLRTRLLQERPDIFLGVDAPDFNLDLEADLRAAGIKTVHFVSPSVWAWRPQRMEKIRRSADHVLCIFPFEPTLLQHNGIAATYVGHPLAQVIPLEPDRHAARQALGLQDGDAVVAILPGSRDSEVAHLTDRFFQAAALILKERPATRFIVPAAPGFRAYLQQQALRSGLGECLQVLDGKSHTALAACDVTLLASGTATLEAALFKRPMVISYHQSRLSWAIMRRKRLQPWVGLPNILCGEFVVPELLQDDATPARLAQETLTWLRAPEDDPLRMQQLNAKFVAMHHELRRDTATIASDVIQKILQS